MHTSASLHAKAASLCHFTPPAVPCRPKEAEHQKAATKIQTFWRGFVARKTISQMRQQFLLRQQQPAATTIQSFWRGSVARKRVSQMRQARRAWGRLSQRAQSLSVFLAHARMATRRAKLTVWNAQQRYAYLAACVYLMLSHKIMRISDVELCDHAYI